MSTLNIREQQFKDTGKYIALQPNLIKKLAAKLKTKEIK